MHLFYAYITENISIPIREPLTSEKMKLKSWLFLLAVLVSWNCSAFNVTFRVDMSNVTGFTTPEVNGTFNNWCGSCAPMSDVNNDQIWELTIPLNAGTYEYKFSYDNFAGQEQFSSLHLDPPIAQALDQHSVVTAPRQMQADHRAMLVTKAGLTDGEQRRGMV